MLENIVANKGLPSDKLIADLRAFCSLPEDALLQIRDAFNSLSGDVSEESAASTITERLQGLGMDTADLQTIPSVVIFLWRRWASHHLTKEKILADLRSINIPQNQIENVSPTLDAMETTTEELHRQQTLQFALASVTPRIDSAFCFLDARAIFKSHRHDSDRGEEQAYFEFDRFVPVVLLEIVSELNEQKKTQSYLLTEKELTQMVDILSRACTRLKSVKKHLGLKDDTGCSADKVADYSEE